MGELFMHLWQRVSNLRSTALAAAVLVACASPQTSAGRIHVVDDAGDTVRLAEPARRVVSLIPATTELLFAIGAGPNLVGRTAWCDYPPAAAQVPNLGDGIRPNLEAIVAQHPDLVVLYRSAQNTEAASGLRALKIPVIQMSVDRLADVDRVSAVLGRLTGRVFSADSLASAFDSALARATVSADSASRPKVLILVWDQPPMTVGAGSFLTELVERAGGRNLFADVQASSAQVSVEAVVKRDPDLVFVTTEGTPAFAERPEWRTVRAIREKRFLRVTNSSYNRPSPRAPEAITQLSSLLHRSP
jgi:ABC-type Fe3+-hydroxamate transport system substrate-binding protein